jgi:Protein of unknown function (DUF2530)
VTEPATAPRELKPLDPPMTPFALIGMGVFAVAGIVLLIAGAPHSWLWTCLAGFLWGIVGLLAMLRHDANRRRRRAATPPAA